MALPINVSERERLKFREGASGLPVVAVTNDDGSPIGASSSAATIFQGTSPWEISTSSLPTVNVGTLPTVTINSPTVFQGTSPWSVTFPSGATVIIGSTINVLLGSNATLNPSPNFIGLVSTASIQGKVELVASSTFVGLATVVVGNTISALLGGNATLNPSPNFIGLVSTASIQGKVELVASSANIGFATIIDGSIQSTLVHGMVSSASGALVQFPTNTTDYFTVEAFPANATTCYLGGSLATINNGYALEPGQSIGFALNNTNKLWLVGVGVPCEVRFIGAD